MKKIISFLLVAVSLFSATIEEPTMQLKADGSVIDLVYRDGTLYAATDASVVDVFNVKENKIIQKIEVSKIKDFMGDVINSKIYSVDAIEDKILVLSQGEHGFRRIDIFKDEKLTSVIPVEDKLYIAKAKFLDSDTIIFGLLGNDIISYDIKTKKKNWSIQASQSKFSNFVFNEDKSSVVVCDESGDLHVISTKDGKITKVFSGENLDNVFQLDYKSGIIATAGQDRRVVVYDVKSDSAYYKTASFLIYSVGLSPSGKLVGYASDENNNVTIFKTTTKSTVAVLGGNKMTLTNILFISENELFVASDDRTINFYRLK